MKIAFYCQHILGIGHLRRSLTICESLLHAGHQIYLILGGPKTEIDEKKINIIQLPGLYMDENFTGLMPCEPSLNLEETKAKRKTILYNFFLKEAPDIFITELYPLGRKAFRFELEPVLKGMRNGDIKPAKCFSSVRDILVEKTEDREQFEQRAVNSLNKYFHGLLIHSDEEIIKLSETFAATSQISIPCYYTGFIAPKSVTAQLLSENKRPLVIASIGGGNVGSKLLKAVCEVAKEEKNIDFKIFSGRYSENTFIDELKAIAPDNLQIEGFSSNFQEEICRADLSISMAGYNTCMNLLRAGIPALLLPFKQNREQELRIQKLGTIAPLTILTDTDLAPTLLLEKITTCLKKSKVHVNVDLNGADKTVTIIENFCRES
ncbi:MAG: glycosyl transferase [Desulfotalea sp.]